MTRHIRIGGSGLTAFVDLFNAYNRRNPRAYDAVVTTDGPTVTLARRVDALLPRVPSFGISWVF